MVEVEAVRCWFCPVDGETLGAAERLLTVVAPAEQRAAARMRQPGDRAALLAAHALVRLAVGDALGGRVDACYVRRCHRCGQADHGKPSLPRTGREFSVSHTRGMVVVAIGTEPLGVDLEPPRPDLDWSSLATLVFTPAERDRLAALGDDEARTVGLRLWVRKEAVLKLLGVGLGGSATDVDVSQTSTSQGWYPVAGAPVRVRDIDVPEGGYVAALASHHEVERVEVRRVSTDELLAGLARLGYG